MFEFLAVASLTELTFAPEFGCPTAAQLFDSRLSRTPDISMNRSEMLLQQATGTLHTTQLTLAIPAFNVRCIREGYRLLSRLRVMTGEVHSPEHRQLEQDIARIPMVCLGRRLFMTPFTSSMDAGQRLASPLKSRGRVLLPFFCVNSLPVPFEVFGVRMPLSA